MFKFILLILSILIFGCNYEEGNNELNFNNLKGNWEQEGENILEFNTLVFEDSALIVGNLIDTIFRFQFNLKDKIIKLKDIEGNSYMSEIVLLDSLNLTINLSNKNKSLKYFRRKKG